MPDKPNRCGALSGVRTPLPNAGACSRPATRNGRTAALWLLAALSGCQRDLDVLCAVNQRSAERALGRAQSDVARSHYEVARRACPHANLRILAQQLDRVEHASLRLADSSEDHAERFLDQALAARVLEAERLGSIVMWAARARKTPFAAIAQTNCHKRGDPDGGWCDGLTGQGVKVRYLQSDPETFRWVATFAHSTALDCALFGPTLELRRWTDMSNASPVERVHCRVTGGPFDDFELLVEAAATFQRFSLFSPDFAGQPDFRALLSSPTHRTDR